MQTKKNYLILILTLFALSCNVEKSTLISDDRSKGFTSLDTSTVGHSEGDLIVIRELVKGEGANAKHDTLDLYSIHFFKPNNGVLKNYLLMWNDLSDYNKASYKWLS